MADRTPAGIDDERLRRQQRFDFIEPEKALIAARNEPRRRRVEEARRAFDFSRERRDAGLMCPARAKAARAALICRRRIAIPPMTSSKPARDAGSSGAYA